MTWTPDSWQTKPVVQQPTYPDRVALDAAVATLKGLPPLVTSWEVNRLKSEFAAAARGERFVLQGGDCAESFADCRAELITNRLKVLLQMSLVLTHGLKQRVTRVGRFAGQYAKPRSTDTETKNGITLPSYRGDLVNAPEFTAEARVPDPARLLEAHSRSAMTINFVRGLIDGGFADLHHPEYWDLDWVQHAPLAAQYQATVDAIGDSLRFMETLAGQSLADLQRVDFYTSHEALLLWAEQAQTRQVPRQPGWFNLSTHFPWIGLRTAALDGAHVEYCSGLANPIGVKVGPTMDADWVLALCEALNPRREEGKVVLIHRMGVGKIAAALPPVIEAVKKSGHPVLWLADPMHGNTQSASNGLKTRAFDDIAGELTQSFRIHRECGSRLGGVHLELTGEDVTECTGGARKLTDTDLERAYKSSVDPRLNYEQALELSMKIVAANTAAGVTT
ncbi:MAG: 3-deoxy-7-phosphoheptulonate synthase class II [Pseudomonadota bacterium]